MRKSPGRDYNFTHAPVINSTSLWVFCSYVNELDYELEQCDVNTAYLCDEFEERVYMAITKGLAVDGKRVIACQLDKALYGLNQSAAVRHKLIRKAFLRRGFTPLKSGPCKFNFVALYVDDTLVAALSKPMVEKVISSLEEEFRLKRLGAAQIAVGINSSGPLTQVDEHTHSDILRTLSIVMDWLKQVINKFLRSRRYTSTRRG
ncbi:hypothetical protein CCR75_001206 [Bremia lactucae]|uniref:Reverse transcriptase Ty1/copia-type domain-containing protein n=1 Tax=Bremia lactucae TaxID=4779 RepID=A0A976FPW6_BRELC|nr:hypothetical protein CCR75_001206 [Bremia lactucae]